MKVIKPQRLSLLNRPIEAGGQCFLSVAAVLFCPFDEPRRLLPEMELWPLVADELQGAPLDDCMPKAGAEFLVSGRAYPRGGAPAIICAPRAAVGSLAKTLHVVGDRFWEGGAPSAPVPYRELRITWAHAFGGPGYDLNPLGKGAAALPTPSGKRHPLPNVEDPRHPIRSQRDRPPPAGFGPYDLSWPQRAKKAGTYDRTWLETLAPGFAADLDWSFFNCAPEDQRQESAFRGDEPFAFDFMHPERPRVEGRLPGAAARCLVNLKTPSGEELRELRTELDTLWFFPHLERAALLFHGMIPIAEDDAADVLQIVAAIEELGSPRPIEHYRRVLAERLDPEKGGLAALRDRDLVPAWPGCGGDLDDDLAQAMKPDALSRNMRRRAEREFQEQRAAILADGGDPRAYGMPDALPEEQLPTTLDGLIEHADRASQDAERQVAEGDRAYEADFGSAPRPEPTGGPPDFSAAAELEELRQAIATDRAAGVDTSALEERLASPEHAARLREMEEQAREGYRATAHHAPAASPGDTARRAALRDALVAALRAGESVAGLDLSCAELRGFQAPGANLSDAWLEGADLTGANLAGADLSRAVLARASLTDADLTGANLTEANLGSARLTGARLSGANLQEAVLMRAELERADLRGARLAGANLNEARLAGVDASEIVAPELLLFQAHLPGARLAGADLTKSTFLEADIEGVDFTGAKLGAVTFLSCKGRRARLRGAVAPGLRLIQGELEEADLRDAELSGANLRGAKLARADLRGAQLTGADLSEADLTDAQLGSAVARGARFVRAQLGGASLVGADLMETLLQKADVRAADLRGASLYGADLARIHGDERTMVACVNVKKVRLDPKRVR